MTEYTHPLDGTTTATELAEGFRDTFRLNAEAHDTITTIPLEQNWDVAAIEDLVEDLPFSIVGHDTQEVTVTEN